jgi:ATP-dependent DNA helicase RecQ
LETIEQVLLKYWGFKHFRPLQEEIIKSVLEGNDTIALLPTGGGKSITFQVPALVKPGTCIVVTPLISLMIDQVKKLEKLGIRAFAIHSGLTYNEINNILNHCIYGDAKFLYISPERIQSDYFKVKAQYLKVNFIVVDEAHCISQWGYDFRPSYLQIIKLREFYTDVPVLALTATATSKVIDDIREKLGFSSKFKLFKTSFERKNLVYLVRNVEDKLNYIVKSLKNVSGSGIIYVRNRKTAKEIALLLIKNKISADYYHAGLTIDVRNEKQLAWQNGHIRIIVATNAFGMGIDKANVRFVIHYDLPDSIEAYFQETGRAGRDGKKSFVVLLFNKSDIVKAEQRVSLTFPEIDQIKAVYQALCNYFQLPIGAGKGIAFDFNLSDFISAYHLNAAIAYNSLKFLEAEGYIELTDEINCPSRVHFLVKRDELYKFQVANAPFDEFIKLLLRSYTGLFTDYVNIDENILAQRSNTKFEVIYEYLKKLRKLKIIDYIPLKTTPLLIFTEERLDEKNLLISHNNYLLKKNRYIEKLNAMIEYASSKNKCRVKILLAYFDETDYERCGQCDVCTERNELNLSKYEFDLILNKIKTLLKNENFFPDELIEKIDFNKDKALKVLQWLIDHNKIIYDQNNKLKWNL